MGCDSLAIVSKTRAIENSGKGTLLRFHHCLHLWMLKGCHEIWRCMWAVLWCSQPVALAIEAIIYITATSGNMPQVILLSVAKLQETRVKVVIPRAWSAHFVKPCEVLLGLDFVFLLAAFMALWMATASALGGQNEEDNLLTIWQFEDFEMQVGWPEVVELQSPSSKNSDASRILLLPLESQMEKIKNPNVQCEKNQDQRQKSKWHFEETVFCASLDFSKPMAPIVKR